MRISNKLSDGSLSTFLWNNEYKARIVTTEDTWCYFKPRFCMGKPAVEAAPYGYIIEVPLQDRKQDKKGVCSYPIICWGNIRRQKYLRRKNVMLLQVIPWDGISFNNSKRCKPQYYNLIESFFDFKPWGMDIVHLTLKKERKIL